MAFSFRLGGALSMATTTLSDLHRETVTIAVYVIRCIEHFAAWLFTPLAKTFAAALPRLLLDGGGGHQIDAALFQDNRHESRVPRRSSARNI